MKTAFALQNPLSDVPARDVEVGKTHPSPSGIAHLRINELKEVSISVTTDRLKIETITQTALQTLTSLYSDEGVMKFYARGGTLPMEYAEKRILTWTERARNGDPFHGYLISQRCDLSRVGVCVLGYSDTPGIAEFARVLFQKEWNKGYGYEVARAIVGSLAPALQKEGYGLMGSPFTAIQATSDPANIGSKKSLLRAGFVKVNEIERFDSKRDLYQLAISQPDLDCLERQFETRRCQDLS